MSKGNKQSFVQRLPASRIHSRKVLVRVLAICLLFTLGAALAQSASTTSQEPAELTFAFWGSPAQKEAVESMIADFMEAYPHIQVRAEHVPTAYEERMSTMVAAGNPPDVAYLGEALAFPWAEEGVILDLTPFFQEDPEAANRLEKTYYRYGEDKILGTNTAAEIINIFYNKELFDAADVAYPPSRAEEAWAWDEFVEVAKRLTKDNRGRDATQPDFDPDNIETYGVAFPHAWIAYVPLIYSNGGSFANEEGTELLLNQPEAVEVLQKLQDLIYVHHVAPTPAQASVMPSTDVMMMTGMVAMDINGHWKVLDYGQLDFEWSVGVLPYFEEPVTIIFGAPTVIFAATRYPDAAFEFYKFHNRPEYVDLFRKGLWMPLQLEYYTEPEEISEWLESEEGVYPPEARDVFVDYTLNHTPYQPPSYWLRNWGQIISEAVNPAMELLWTGGASAQEAMDQAVRDAAPLMQGRWTD